jgi:hypothetical protein
MLVQNLSFARLLPKKPLLPLFSVIGGGKRRQDVLPASLFPVFGISPFFSCFESEIRAGIFLQEELVGGRPHHCLKGPKREIFVTGIFTEIRPVWVGDLETRPKNLKSLCLGLHVTLHFLGFLF